MNDFSSFSQIDPHFWVYYKLILFYLKFLMTRNVGDKHVFMVWSQAIWSTMLEVINDKTGIATKTKNTWTGLENTAKCPLEPAYLFRCHFLAICLSELSNINISWKNKFKHIVDWQQNNQLNRAVWIVRNVLNELLRIPFVALTPLSIFSSAVVSLPLTSMSSSIISHHVVPCSKTLVIFSRILREQDR